jgi:hypothetical protein
VTDCRHTTRGPLDCEAFLYAHFFDKLFVIRFASLSVCRNWLKRSRSLRGVDVEFCGETFLAGYKDDNDKQTEALADKTS